MRCYWLRCCKLLSYLIVRWICQYDFCCHLDIDAFTGWSLIDVPVGLLGFTAAARFQYTLLLSIGFNLLTVSLTESLIHISSTRPGFEALCGWSAHLFITLISIMILCVYFFSIFVIISVFWSLFSDLYESLEAFLPKFSLFMTIIRFSCSIVFFFFLLFLPSQVLFNWMDTAVVTDCTCVLTGL